MKYIYQFLAPPLKENKSTPPQATPPVAPTPAPAPTQTPKQNPTPAITPSPTPVPSDSSTSNRENPPNAPEKSSPEEIKRKEIMSNLNQALRNISATEIKKFEKITEGEYKNYYE